MQLILFKRLGCERIREEFPDRFAMYRMSIAAWLFIALVSFPLAALTVENLEDDLFWKGAGGCESKQGMELYLSEFPEGKYVTEAIGCMEWEEIRDCEDKMAVESFLKQYPENLYVPNAQACRAKLQEKEQRDNMIDRLLSECQAHYDSHRLTTGSGGNALDCYSRVLERDPGNAEALAGIQRIEQHYVDRAESELERRSVEAALRWIERLESINPEHPQVEELKRRVEFVKERIATQKQILQEIEALLEQGEAEMAQSLLESRRKDVLDGKTISALETKINQAIAEAEQEQLLQDGILRIRNLIREGETAAARVALEKLVETGLDDGRRAGLEAEIAERERQKQAAQMARLLEECEDHFESDRLAEALSCYRKVLEIDKDHGVASERVNRIGSIMAWKSVDAEKTVDGYYKFERDYPQSPLAKLARLKLAELEEEYWRSIERSGNQSNYRRYLEIYPKGQFRASALSRTTGEN